MSYGLFQVLLIVLTIGILFILKLPFLIEILIVIPLLTIIFTFIVTIYNNKAFLKLIPISTEELKNRLENLSIDISNFETLSFRKEDAFYLRTVPDCLACVLKHTNIPIWGCIYDYGKKRVFEFISQFENISLSTCSDKNTGNIPKIEGDLLQVFDGFDIESLFDNHIQGVRYLQKKGFHLASFSSGDFRRQYKEDIKEFIQHIHSFSFWVLRLLYWEITKHGKKYAFPIEEQVESPIYKSKSDKLYQKNLKKILAASLSSPTYNILFNGSIREGYTIDRVQNNLAKIFKTNRNRIGKLFRGKKIIIKKNIEQELAKKYHRAFHRAGATCIIQKANPDKKNNTFINVPKTTHHAKIIKEEKIGCFAYALAVSSFIPLYGVPMGVVSVILGYIKRKVGGLKIALIGGLGILFTIICYSGSLYLFNIFKKDGTIDKMTHQMAEQHLTELVRSIEFYKLQHDNYPQTLEQLQEETEEHIWITDMTDLSSSDNRPKNYYYELDPSGSYYYLLSAGPDGILLTEDDIYPPIAENELGRLGYRIKE